MLKNKAITFRHGDILTVEQLEELYRYPREYLQILYDRYPDGILLGLDVEERENGLWITKGLAKYQGEIFLSAEDINLTEAVSDADKDTAYLLVFSPEESSFAQPSLSASPSSVRLRELSPRLERAGSSVEGLPFARFKLNRDGKLDLHSRLDRESGRKGEFKKVTFWNMSVCPYSSRGGRTFHPYIFRMASELLGAKQRKTVMDLLILNNILTDGIVERKMLELYIQAADVSVVNLPEADDLQLLSLFFQTLGKNPADTRPLAAGVPAETAAPNKGSMKGGKVLEGGGKVL